MILENILKSARSILYKDNTKKTIPSIQNKKVERLTPYSLKLKLGELSPHIPEWQQRANEKRSNILRNKLYFLKIVEMLIKMTSLFSSSVYPVKKYAMERSFVPLIASSESFIISYDEYPRPLIRLFNSNCSQAMCLYLPSLLVDMCYSSDLDSFILLSTTYLYKLNPSIGKIELINDYHLLKENRSMSSICSTNDQRLFILYRFGEYLDTYPKGKRIWKRRHLCDSISEDIALIRSSKDNSFLLGLLIVEWNGTWRVDIFSSSLHKLHTGFRFTGWTRETWLSEWSPDKCWFVGSTHRLMIDSKGQPINIPTNQLDSDINNITWMINTNNEKIKMIVTRGQKLLTFFK